MRNKEVQRETFQEGFCKTNHISVHYTRTGGNKPPIVLLHGLAANGLCWKIIARALADRYDVIMPDARGHGKSSAPARGYTYENLKDDVLGFLAAMNLTNVVLAGHSMGGLTAAMAACRSPFIRAVVLADPTFLSSERQQEVWESDAADRHREMLSLSLTELIAERKKAHPDRSDELNGLFAAARLQTSINAFEILKPPNPEYRQIIKEIKCPCLLLYGDRGILNDGQADELRRINPLVTAVEIKNAGHGIFADQPRQFAENLIQFIDAL